MHSLASSWAVMRLSVCEEGVPVHDRGWRSRFSILKTGGLPLGIMCVSEETMSNAVGDCPCTGLSHQKSTPSDCAERRRAISTSSLRTVQL